MVEHLAGKLFEDRLSFHVEVAEHGGGFPTTKELDVVAVDPTAKQGHGAPGAGRASGEVGWVNAGCVLEGASGKSNLTCDVGGADCEGSVGGVVVCGETDGGVKRTVALTKPFDVGDDEASERFYWAAQAVTTAALGDDFATTLVLLRGEMETCAGGVGDVADGGVFEVKFARADVEVDVAEGEGLGGGATVFGRAEQEEEGDADCVGKGYGLEQHGQGGSVCVPEEERH